MECNCRDLGRHFKFQQERYSPGYYDELFKLVERVHGKFFNVVGLDVGQFQLFACSCSLNRSRML